jgi:hypothetical protein
MRGAELDPKLFRGRLRQSIPAKRFAADQSERLHRSSAAKAVFSDAERYAGLVGGTVFPVHLLYTVLIAKEEHHDCLLDELKVDKRRLKLLAKDAILSNGIRGQEGSDDRK